MERISAPFSSVAIISVSCANVFTEASVTLYVIVSPISALVLKRPVISVNTSASAVSPNVRASIALRTRSSFAPVSVIVNVCVLESLVPSFAVIVNSSVSSAPAASLLIASLSATYLYWPVFLL